MRIALYTQKHNRYVSMSVGNRWETLITKPFTVDGRALQVNSDASRGEMRVALAKAEPVATFGGTTASRAPHLLQDNLLPGFTFDDCMPIVTNGTEINVLFRDMADLASLEGMSVCFLFRMYNSDLYAFRCHGG